MSDSIREIYKSIEYCEDIFPEEKIKELLNRESELRSFLIDYIKDFKRNIFKHLNEDNYMGHIYAVIILAQFKEQALCPLFLEFLRLPGTRVYELFDTLIPEYGARILASVYDGNINNMLDAINDKRANEYARTVIIEALKVLCINKKVDVDRLENLFINLLDGELRSINKTMLLEILYTAFELNINNVLEKLKVCCRSGKYKKVLSVEEIEAEIRLYEEGMYINAGINDVHNREITNAVEELKKLFKLIVEKDNFKKQTKEFKDTIIEEINLLAKKFEKGIYSIDFKEQLESLSKNELNDIGRNLNLKGYYKLRKEELKNLIIEDYERIIEEKLYYFDEKRARELMMFVKKGGVRKVEKSSQFAMFFYLESYGFVFPFSDREITCFIMPDLIVDIIKNISSGFLYRKSLKRNTEIITLIRGMMEAYGIMTLRDLVIRLRMYGIDEEDKILYKVINEGSGLYYSILDRKYILNETIDSYSLIEEIKKVKDKYDYKFFTKDELKSMGQGDWINNVDYAQRFYEDFSEEFVIESENLVNIIDDMKANIQVVDSEVITQYMLDSIDPKCNDELEVEELKETKKIVKKLVKEFLENIPLWKYKGRSIKDMKK